MSDETHKKLENKKVKQTNHNNRFRVQGVILHSNHNNYKCLVNTNGN